MLDTSTAIAHMIKDTFINIATAINFGNIFFKL